MKLYQGTQFQIIKLLEPFATKGNAISKPVVCFTSNYCMALLYIWKRSYKWVAFSENEEGIVVFTEHYDNMMFDFYNDLSGSIYQCDGDNPAITPTHMKGVYTSDIAVPVEKEMRIENVYAEIIKQELLGNIIIQRYNHLSAYDKDKIFNQTVRAIHLQKMLIPSDYVHQQNMVDFVQAHFSKAWEAASKMSDEEIKQMIREWRESLQK